MHPEQKQFIERVRLLFPTKFIGGKVLDVGSMDINGNNRQFFYQSEYVGMDIAPGPNVDIVNDLPDKEFQWFGDYFDTVISTECMEHNKHYRNTIKEMYRVLKPGGLMLMTMASHKRPEHGTKKNDPIASPHTGDYYKNLYIADLADVLQWEVYFFPYCFEYSGAYDLYFYGIKTL